MENEELLSTINVPSEPVPDEPGRTLAPPADGLPDPINLAPVSSDTGLPPTPGLADKRVAQTQFGLGPVLQKTDRELYDAFYQGRESDVRAEAVARLDQDLQKKREQLYVDYAKNKKGPLSVQELDALTNHANTIYRPFDPESVIEKAYANKFLSALNVAQDYLTTTALFDAEKEVPEQLAKIKMRANSLGSKMMFARKVQDNMADAIEQQSWLGWGADQVKNLFQPYVEAKMRGWNKEVGTFSGGLLLGDNLKEQADKLFLLPEAQFQKGLTDITEALRKDNPTLAKQFADYVVGRSTSEKNLDNFFTILGVADYQAVGALGVNALRKASVYNRASKAFKDQVKATENLGKGVPDGAVAAEGAGNIVEAGTQRGAAHAVDSINGTVNPIKDVKETLTSNYLLDGEIFDKNPGKLSRENLTRIKDSFAESANSLWNAVTKAARVNRSGLASATEEGVRAYQEQVLRKMYTGPNNSILDISSPRLEPASNTRWFDITFSNQDGNLFSNPETAANAARKAGFVDVKILERKGATEVEPERFAGGVTDLRNKTRLEKSIPETERGMKKWNREVRKKGITAEEKAEAQQQAKFFKETLARYKEELKAINTRVTTVPARVEQNGLGYSYTITVPYRETEDITRNFLIKDKNGNYVLSAQSSGSPAKEGFESWKNAALGWIRGANDTLSMNETAQRLKATYSQSVLQKWANDEAKKLSDVAAGLLNRNPVTGERIPWYVTRPRAFLGKFTGGNRQMFNEFNSTLDYARTAKDPITGETGYFFKTPGDLDAHYQLNFNRLPTLPEYEAYFAHVKLTEGDRVFREIAEFRNRARIGTEQHQLFFKDDKGQRVGSGFFDAIHQKTFPGGKDQILIMGEKKGQERLAHLGGLDISPQELAKLKKEVEEGKAKIFRIYDPDSHPLREFSDVAGNERVRYILTRDSETKPLEFNHVNRRGGGHFEYDHEFYIKQARLVAQAGGPTGTDKRRGFHVTYAGDTTLMGLDTRASGKDIVPKLDRVRQMIKDKAPIDDIDLYIKQNLFMEPKEVKGWFKPSRDPNGKMLPPRLSLDEPFYVVPRNKKIYDLDKTLEDRVGKDIFVDGTKSGSDAQQFQVHYTMQRDSEGLKRLQDVGSQGNPVYKWTDAKMMDPIPTMNRALNRAIQSVFMDDYKMFAVEHWLAEAATYMKASESEIRSAPFWHFNNPDFKPGVDKDKVWNLMSNRQKITEFVGKPNLFNTWVHGATQTLADAFYTRYGPEESRGALTKAATITPIWLLNKASDPVQLLRSFTFNAKLGVFNPVQFIVQAQTHALVIGLEPRHGTLGTFAAFMHQWTRVNKTEAFMDKLDDMYTKMNMFGSRARPGEFKEANSLLSRMGFEHVGGEYAMADDILEHKFIKNDWNNFLDAGRVFFREGERSARLAAWYSAFRKFRHENPVGKITAKDAEKILLHADTLNGNMSRASASALHTGIFSPSTQFLSFQLRQAELFLGKRLGETTMERNLARARLVTFYSGLYGIPAAVGVSGFPFGDSIRQYAMEHGYVVGENYISSLMNEGVPAVLGAMISGGGDMQKGTMYNVGNRYGSQGLTTIKQLFSDTPMWKIIGGASANTAVNTWTSLTPFWRTARSLVSSDETDNQFQLTPSDFLAPLQEVSSVASAKRFIYAMNTGRWLNRNEQYIQDVTGSDALFRTITGLTDQNADDQYKMYEIRKSEEQIQKEAKKEITKYYQRAIQATNDNDFALAQKLFKNARVIMIQAGISPSMAAEIYAQAGKGYEDMISTGNWSFGTNQDAPVDKQEMRLDRLRRQLQLDEKKRQ